MDIDRYHEVTNRLKEKFPPGTVRKRDDQSRAYIPNQVYTDRLERVLQGEWSKEIKELEINVPNQYVKAIVRVYIGPYYRDGSAVASITKQGIENAEARAKSAAFVDALDTWELGWTDLAPYNEDWGKNPALAYLLDYEPNVEVPSFSSMSTTTDHRCIFCQRFLTEDDINILKQIPNFNIQKMKYCADDLPDAFVRKLEPVANALPENYKKRLLEALDKKRKV
ncbi:Rad52/Rad22 family DNA repair protein [Paenibacillus sp. IITD108]|uniref:Rad52/Rad22 family DNA repair protein n=1 Tax=Paenibacillus sp. IITD108 TaxID=3116649 RepID=UPI002F3F8A26